eukprot:TRINITY_DN10405_c0_g1_i1.p1 TRINITY_DN10405_c0_g1~~TRINITY_DN10405_c0_g1_i1.p1  ORF type:complete len:141 (+),score=35.36 TRINITY_DN10405_c0_g1_i1:95-517(+)
MRRAAAGMFRLAAAAAGPPLRPLRRCASAALQTGRVVGTTGSKLRVKLPDGQEVLCAADSAVLQGGGLFNARFEVEQSADGEWAAVRRVKAAAAQNSVARGAWAHNVLNGVGGSTALGFNARRKKQGQASRDLMSRGVPP